MRSELAGAKHAHLRALIAQVHGARASASRWQRYSIILVVSGSRGRRSCANAGSQLRETISRQKEREEWFSNKQVYDFGLFKKKMIPPYAIPHPTPAWVGPSKDKILYDQGKCKILYMNDLEHGNILDPEMCADMHNWLLVRLDLLHLR